MNNQEIHNNRFYPTVTTIVPVYKVDLYLSRCIRSILKQRNQDFELIMTDDGSPDNSGSMCDEFAITDNRSIVIHQPNGGLSAARNSGLDIAEGKYISFVDSDDWIAEDLLSTAVPYMEAGYQSVNFGHVAVLHNEENKKSPKIIGEICNDSEQKKADFLLHKLIHYQVGWEAWSRLYSRNLIEQKKIRFADNNIIFAEDLFFALCYYAHAERHFSIENAPYFYLLRENSIMGKEANQLNANRMNELLKRVYEFYKDSNVSKEIIQIFPVLYYFVMKHSIMQFQNDRKLPFEQLCTMVMSDLDNKEFAKKQIRKLQEKKKIMLYFYHPRCKAEYMIEQARYFVFGNELLHAYSRVKQKMLSMLDDEGEENEKN